MEKLDPDQLASELLGEISARMHGTPVPEAIVSRVNVYSRTMMSFLDTMLAASGNPMLLTLVQAVEDAARDVRLAGAALREEVGRFLLDAMGTDRPQ